MSIRDQIRRALRKSDGSADSSSTSATVSSNISQSSDTSLTLQKTTSILSRAFTWGGREKDTEFSKPEKKKPRKTKRSTHPSEKPLTEQNLRHQEMFSHFTMTFGASDPSQIDRLSFDGISPCCTRRPSLEFTSEEESQPNRSSITDEYGAVPP